MSTNSLTDFCSMSLNYAKRDLLFVEVLHALHDANRVYPLALKLTTRMDWPKYSGENVTRFNRLLERLIRLYRPVRCPKCGEVLSACDCTIQIPTWKLMKENYHV